MIGWTVRVGPTLPDSSEARRSNRMSSFYITTAIDYINGEPHLGHAYEKIGTDVVARYKNSGA